MVAFDIDARFHWTTPQGTHDLTGKVELAALEALGRASTSRDLRTADFHVVTMPTPIDTNKAAGASRPTVGERRAAIVWQN